MVVIIFEIVVDAGAAFAVVVVANVAAVVIAVDFSGVASVVVLIVSTKSCTKMLTDNQKLAKFSDVGFVVEALIVFKG